MRIGFAGTPAFAAVALQAILEAGYAVVVVLAQPDRPQGRGLTVKAGPVAALARARGIPLLQPGSLRAAEERAPLESIALDVLVVAAYGLILPQAVLDWPRCGCVNIHASLLPRWRGAAPIQRALIAGDAETGVSIMQMDAGLDTGSVIVRHRVPIAARETAGTLHDKLARIGGEAIVATLAAFARHGRLAGEPQNAAAASYAAKIQPGESVIDWRSSAQSIDRLVRALNPNPGARTALRGAALKIWGAEPVSARVSAPGRVLQADPSGILVGCGEGALAVRELQPANGKRMSAAAFLAGHPLAENTLLGADDALNRAARAPS